MAVIQFKAGESFSFTVGQLEKLALSACKHGVYEGAKVAIENIKPKIPVDTGDMRDSFGISPFETDETGVNTKLGFAGYDRKGVPNQLKARAIESGTSTMQKRPFMRPAIKACKAHIEQTLKDETEKELKKNIKNG